MDAISDRAFTETAANTAQNIHKVIDETPSLLTVILDLHPLEWKAYMEKNDNVEFRQVTSAMLVMLNSHLALNSGNKVSVYVANSFYHGAKRIFPMNEEDLKVESESDTSIERKSDESKQSSVDIDENENENNDDDDDDDDEIVKPKRRVVNQINTEPSKQLLKSIGIYGQFKVIDEKILDALDSLYNDEPERLRELISKDKNFVKGTMTGAISSALTAINKLQKSEETINMKARVMIISVSGDNTLPYVSMMNTIFAAQKMKVSLDVCKLGETSIFLQQTSDATNGVYIDIKHPSGLIQYLSSALFIEPLLRPIVVLPTNTSIDFRASCFVTNKVIDIGYVCSVCLCILSMVPTDEKCPTCFSKFEHKLIARMKRKPKVLPLEVKKRKIAQ
ncbi:RNA polymerase II transcription factor B subunit 4 [Pichia californica]|uniref:General transcription and DNA repair factor IIH subunit TFB4 n=1 Tax=Pichia californica TaxID=460514 RepID=A0A9P7BEI0_9ASCO|nr:RNA polymerase II transcription factor B subunit 4 [[Candida] californica]KAG0689342.1 RNA polymerase II transcription factor B subunit 4 [[Candida] californica]